MARLVIDMPSELEQRLRARAAEAGFPSTEEYARALLLADAADPGAPPHLSYSNDSALQELLLQRLDQLDAGELTSQTFNTLRQRILRQSEHST